MTRDEILAIVSTVVADELVGVKAELASHVERAVAAKPLPPFVPPPVWTEGRHGAGVVVRHRNGLFLARRDTEGEPGKDDAWLPLLVGLAGLDLRWEGRAHRGAARHAERWHQLRDDPHARGAHRARLLVGRGRVRGWATASSASANGTRCRPARASSPARPAARSTG